MTYQEGGPFKYQNDLPGRWPFQIPKRLTRKVAHSIPKTTYQEGGPFKSQDDLPGRWPVQFPRRLTRKVARSNPKKTYQEGGPFNSQDDLPGRLPVQIPRRLTRKVARSNPKTTYQEGGPFKQKHLIGLYDLGKVSQVRLQLLYVWNELVHNGGPRLEQIKHKFGMSWYTMEDHAWNKSNTSLE